ncbi:hypothetical protein ON064_10240 [Planococcus sp. A6]|uniref:hypothetical protein n=1 Tax=Planococcus sp. A6 TaxID=2992760 RepID=UPI00237B0938|nr:hypothetical protein [Planococcus sp. A6]MDE0583412.1 hypothetical protein [Planococcus sp. A6]
MNGAVEPFLAAKKSVKASPQNERTGKMNLYRTLILGALALVTLWLITDFFPATLEALGISSWLILAALACLVIAIFVTPSSDGPPPERGKYSKLTFTAIGLGYPILLMVLLTLLGGESSTGYSLSNPPMWITVAVFLWFSYSDDKKAYKKKMQESKE